MTRTTRTRLGMEALESREVPAFVFSVKSVVVTTTPAPAPVAPSVSGILFPVFDKGGVFKPTAGLTANVAAPGPLAGILLPSLTTR